MRRPTCSTRSSAATTTWWAATSHAVVSRERAGRSRSSGAVSSVAPTRTRSRMFDFVELAACVDVFPERARGARGRAVGRDVRCSLDAVLADPDDRRGRQPHPAASCTPTSTAPRSTPGKAVFSEKPLGVDLRRRCRARGPRDHARVCASAAPPTRSSAPGSRPVARSIDRGDIGEPLAANAFMLVARARSGGTRARRSSTSAAPARCFDMGPYYLTALVQLLGPARAYRRDGRHRASAARRSRRSRWRAS